MVTPPIKQRAQFTPPSEEIELEDVKVPVREPTPPEPALDTGAVASALKRKATPRALLLPKRPAFVHRGTETNDLVHRAGLNSYPGHVELALQDPPTPRKKKPNLLGTHTRYKPLYLVGIGALGNVLYGTGTVAIERGIWPRAPIAPPGTDARMLPPIYQPLFGQRRYSLGIGITSTVAGAGLALLSCVLGFQDSRRLARKANTANPSYTRPNIYFAAHLSAIVLSVGYKFMVEALSDTVGRDTVWLAAMPGLIGQAAFAVTQAQAFSSCELQNGKMPLKYRGEIGFAARFLVALQIIYGVMQGVPYLNSYGKELVRLGAVTSTTLAYSLPLTTARISRQQRTAPFVDGEQPKDSWQALRVLGLYIAGRILAGFGPDLVQQGIVSSRDADPANVAADVFGGAAMLATGTALCVAAIMLYRADVQAYDTRKGNVLAGLAFGALLAVEVYTGLAQYGSNSGQRELIYISLVPGFIGMGLRLAVLPEMFCYSELLNGDLPLKQRYHWTEASRSMAQLCFGAWASMSTIPGFNTYAREAVGIAASAFATLGMALPTTTSRRTLPRYAWPLSPGATPGATPSGERGNPFDGH